MVGGVGGLADHLRHRAFPSTKHLIHHNREVRKQRCHEVMNLVQESRISEMFRRDDFFSNPDSHEEESSACPEFRKTARKGTKNPCSAEISRWWCKVRIALSMESIQEQHPSSGIGRFVGCPDDQRHPWDDQQDPGIRAKAQQVLPGYKIMISGSETLWNRRKDYEKGSRSSSLMAETWGRETASVGATEREAG